MVELLSVFVIRIINNVYTLIGVFKMKKCLFLLVLLLIAPSSFGASSNTRGLLWMSTTEPVYVVSDSFRESSKVGTATSVNWLRLVTTGDAGIKKAVENGNIKKIYYIDQEIKKFIVIYEKRTTRVYGE